MIAKGIMPDFLLPKPIIFIRTSVASIVFWLIALIGPKQKIESGDWLRLIFAGFFGVSLNQLMFFEGLNKTTPINASILMVGIPIAVMVFSRILNQNKISAPRVFGLLLGSSGAIYLILSKGRIDFSGSTFIGNLLVTINVTSYAFFLVILKPLVSKYRPIILMKWIFLFGFLMVIPFTLSDTLDSNFSIIPINIWFSIVYVVVFATIMAYFFNNYSLTRMSAASNSAFIYSQPLIASLFAIISGKEELKVEQIFAAVLIFAGVYFVIKPQKTVNVI